VWRAVSCAARFFPAFEDSSHVQRRRIAAQAGERRRQHAALPARVFLAHRLDGMSYPEIARCTGLSVKQVERQMAKAIYKLCKWVDGHRLNWFERWF
jgi:RNA polymerase sigma-70 factor (ECF subfamily)